MTAIDAGIRKRFLQILLTIIVQGIILFIAALDLSWKMAWIYLILTFCLTAINAGYLIKKDPELIAEQAEIKADVKSWDKPFALIWYQFLSFKPVKRFKGEAVVEILSAAIYLSLPDSSDNFFA